MPTLFEHGFALLIGVGEVSYAPWSLPTTVADMQALYATLTDPNRCADPPDHGHVSLLHDDGATRQIIREGLDWLSESSGLSY